MRLRITTAGSKEKLLLPVALIMAFALCLARVGAAEPPFKLREGFVPYQNHSGPRQKESIAQFVGAGVCALDYDLDGDWDLYFPDASAPDASEATNLLFRNDGGLRFVDVTAQAGVGERGWAGGCAVADIDNDGDPDLYITNQGPNALFINNGDGTFDRAGSDVGVEASGWSTSAAFGDLDGDGWTDLYVCNYIDREQADLKARCNYFGIGVFCGPEGMPGEPDVLYRNENGLKFTDETQASGVLTPDTRGFGVLFTDLDGDFLPEIRVANDATRDLLFKNRGRFRFDDVSLESGVAYASSGMEQSGMGSTAGDFDRDGDQDFYVTHFQRDYNTLFRNEGELAFRDMTVAHGLVVPTLAYLGWGTHFIDVDNDAALDLFVANGHIYSELEEHPEIEEPYRQRNQLFLGDGAGGFTEVPASSHEPERVSRGTAVADLDGDGAVDLVVNNLDEAPDLYHGQMKGRFIRFRLVGVESNRDGLGAVVTLSTGELRQRMELRLSDGFLGSNEPVLHFGLDQTDVVDEVIVAWPSGTTERFELLPAGKLYVVKEGSGWLP